MDSQLNSQAHDLQGLASFAKMRMAFLPIFSRRFHCDTRFLPKIPKIPGFMRARNLRESSGFTLDCSHIYSGDDLMFTLLINLLMSRPNPGERRAVLACVEP
jgi:hypothetical protein